MTNPILSVENISKRFWIGATEDRGARYVIEKLLRQPLSFFQKPPKKEFWALRDLDFQVEEGQKLAVLGRNGAGKSTLLKLISRIILPTQGRVTLSGRVGSLLEVGTGFHPELTGRENIFLNGALLGMRRAEIVKNFDAIVEFAEVAQFLDTPVKRYSSGMYVRLAFAIAAHLQTELLIVDEVLAVGDSRFQKKCISKMNEVNRQGRTVLFVSHNLALVQSVCTNGLLLESGRQIAYGPLDDVIETYQKRLGGDRESSEEGILLDRMPRAGGLTVALRRLRILDDETSSIIGEAFPGSRLSFEIDLALPPENRKHLIVVIKISHPIIGSVFSISSHVERAPLQNVPESLKLRASFVLPPLLPSHYNVSLELRTDGQLTDDLPMAGILEVPAHNFLETDSLPSSDGGALVVKSHWQILA